MGRNKTSNLVAFNSKVVPEIKEISDALIKVKANGCESVHDLLRDMLRLYEETYPQEFKKARAYLELTGGKGTKIYIDQEGV